MSCSGRNLSVSPPACRTATSRCPDKFGCPPGVCPDFVIRRHDTKPSFKVLIEDCDGPLDLTGLVVESSMWALAKLKADITDATTQISFADGIGFEQVLAGDIIIAQRVRGPEKMLVTGFDEVAKTITVTRGHGGTTATAWKKGTVLRVFRFMSQAAATEMVTEDQTQVDGTVLEDQITESYLVYDWAPNDTCVPGCFWLEFKLMKMDPDLPAPDPADPCNIGEGVEWVRRFPVQGEGFLIKVEDSPTAEIITG